MIHNSTFRARSLGDRKREGEGGQGVVEKEIGGRGVIEKERDR
jgi:hypothetical protein